MHICRKCTCFYPFGWPVWPGLLQLRRHSGKPLRWRMLKRAFLGHRFAGLRAELRLTLCDIVPPMRRKAALEAAAV